MGRKSSVDLLPPEIKAQLQELLRDPQVIELEVTQRINDLLEEKGHDERVSKSSVNRYSQRMKKVGARLKQSREVAEMWIGKLGAAPQGEVGKLLNEVIRNLAFEATMNLADGEETASPKELATLALAVQRLEDSATKNLKRDEEIRKQERARASEEAAEEAGNAAKELGLTAEGAQVLRDRILGLKK